MITIEYSGGLGNQLFQYAFSRALELDLNVSVFSDFSNYRKKEKRILCLDKFNTAYKEKETSYLKRRFISMYYKISTSDMPGVYTEKILGQYDVSLIYTLQNLNNPIILLGYWQNHLYFNKHKELLKKELRLNLKSLPILNLGHEDVLIHVRRGDFLFTDKNNNSPHLVCDQNYYENCIKFYRNKYQNPKFYFFSDDINWCKQQYISHDFVFMENNSDLIEFEMMKRFKNYIISNSTFSWWGAYLSDFDETTVLCPKSWWNNRSANISLPNWIKK
tara:strand:+ start:1624 stop:2448 length:825 start_codon:yes stop_codon:yes gene_type:complete